MEQKIIIINLNTSWNIFNFRLDLINELKKNNYKVIAVSPTDIYTKKLIDLGIDHYPIKINQRGTNPISDIGLIINYKKLFSKIKPDLILSYTIKPNIYGNIAAQYLGIPVINNISGLGTMFIKNYFYTILAKILYTISLRYTNWVFFQNNDDLNLFRKSKIVNNLNSSVIMGSGVNTKKFYFNRLHNTGKKFLFPARLIKDKGIFEFLKSAKNITKEYPEIEFLIAGQLNYNNADFDENELNKWLKYKQIKYVGDCTDMISLYKSVDVVVLPSYREGLSKTLIEAASMSLPIITTNVPGCKDVVKHNFNGLLVRKKSVSDLTEKIIQMYQFKSKKRLEFGANGRIVSVEKFDSKIITSHYIQKISNFS